MQFFAKAETSSNCNNSEGEEDDGENKEEDLGIVEEARALNSTLRRPQQVFSKPVSRSSSPRLSAPAAAAPSSWDLSPGVTLPKVSLPPDVGASATVGERVEGRQKVDTVVTWRPQQPHSFLTALQVDLALLYSCPVFTLCNLATMISASCKSHAEVFARSLQAKLHMVHHEDSCSSSPEHLPGWSSSGDYHRGSNNVIVDKVFLPHLGTTFPPRTCAQFDHLKSKYHSESDLPPLVRMAASNNANDSTNNSKKDVSDKSNKSRHPETVLPAEEEGNDSDLFFDFDIGSPEEETSSMSTGSAPAASSSSSMMVSQQMMDDDDVDDDDEVPVKGLRMGFHCRRRDSGSDDSLDDSSAAASINGGTGNKASSTAYGSASSGLWSDGGYGGANAAAASTHYLSSLERPKTLDGLALGPEEWKTRHSPAVVATVTGNGNSPSSSSATPVVASSPANESSDTPPPPPLISPDSLLDEPVGDASDAANAFSEINTDSIPQQEDAEEKTVLPKENTNADKLCLLTLQDVAGPTSSSSSDSTTTLDKKADHEISPEAEMESLSVYTGDHKHKIAHSKLNALIALLEKDNKDYPSAMKPNRKISPTKELPSQTLSNSSGNDCTSPTKKRSFRCSLPPISASPANFSFLSSASKGHMSSSDLEAEGHVQQQPLHRSDSTPELTSRERAYIESPRTKRKGTSPQIAVTGTAAVAEPTAAVKTSDTSKNPAAAAAVATVPAAVAANVAAAAPAAQHVAHNATQLYLPREPVMRRASSLKTGKTPPGTPGRRKIVRFADVFGLDLADVKTFLDEVPRVPRSAYRDLRDAELSDIESDNSSDSSAPAFRRNLRAPVLAAKPPTQSIKPQTTLVPMFNQPGAFPNFFDLLRDRKVCLENAHMAGGGHKSVTGVVRVQNLGFHKVVALKYTINEWITSDEQQATYIQGSCDGFSDKFTFAVAADRLQVGQRLQFCVRYLANNCEEYWDNNGGRNYVFQCLASQDHHGSSATTSLPIPTVSSARHHSYASFSHSPTPMSEEPWMRYL